MLPSRQVFSLGNYLDDNQYGDFVLSTSFVISIHHIIIIFLWSRGEKLSVSSLSHSLANILNTFCIFSSKLLRWNLRSYLYGLYGVRVWMPWLIT